MPELIPRLSYTKNWEDPADYATHQNNEIQNRKDIQSLFTEIETYVNHVMLPRAEQLLSEGGAGGGSGDASGDYLPLDGGTMRGVLRLCRNPELNAEAATKQYVDSVAGSVTATFNGNLAEIRQTADALETASQTYESGITALETRADEMSSAVESLDGDVSALSGNVSTLSGDVSALSGNVSTLSEDVSGLSGNVSTLSEDVSGLSGDVSALSGNVSTLSDDVSGLSDDFSELSDGVSELSGNVTELSGEVSELSETADGLESRVESAEGGLSAIEQTLDEITLSVEPVTDGGEVYSRLTMKVGPKNLYGYIKMDGNVDVTGQLSAEALYAGYGEIANLAVDRLTTSRRIVRYLAGDASDDNFIRIYEQNLEFVTGTPTGGTEQAKNPDGDPLFWPVDVSGLSRGADGYPVNAQQERIYTVTTPTRYPVQVYAYEEAVKRSISFEPVNGIYSPIDRFGAGNQQGNNKAWILKTADGLDIRYLTPDNKEIGIRMTTDGKVTIDGFQYDADAVRGLLGLSDAGDGGPLDLTRVNADGSLSGLSVDADGYTDISGLRKVVSLDFSNIAYGYFSETLDGGILNAYRVQRDAAGRISSITDASGHETVIIWGA